MRPAAGRRSPEIARSIVVLPAPFAPISVTISAAWTSSETPSQRLDRAVAHVEAFDPEQRLAPLTPRSASVATPR